MLAGQTITDEARAAADAADEPIGMSETMSKSEEQEQGRRRQAAPSRSPSSTRPRRRAELARLAARDRPSRRALLSRGRSPRSPTPITMRCASATTAIEARFPHLIRDDSPSLRVGAAPVEAFGKVVHRVPMLSLGNVFDDEDVRDFLERRPALPRPRHRSRASPSRPSPRSTGSPSRCATSSGRLVQGATRGDGYEGENVTANVRTIADIPQTIRRQGLSRPVRGARRDLYGPRRLPAPQ